MHLRADRPGATLIPKRAAALMATVFALVFGLALFAQTATVTGVVVSGNGLPIPGATVTSGSASTTAGADGTFTLAGAGDHLTVSATGFKTVTVTAGTNAVRVVLTPASLSETVTVTATDRNQTTASVPLQTAVMGSARLKAAVPDNVDSVLRSFSDLSTYRESSSVNSHPTTQGVSLLGIGSSGASRALVLVNDLPINDYFGGWVNWLRAPVEDLSSISVVSGGASPLYGSGALTGVIGMQTQTPTQTSLDIRTGGGELGTAFADGVGAIIHDKWALTTRGRVDHVSGFIPNSPSGSVDNNAGVTAQDWAPTLRYVASPKAMFSVSGEYFAANRHNGTVLQVNQTRLRQLAAHGVVDHGGLWDGNVFYQSEDFGSNFSAVAADRNSETLVLEQQVPSLAQGGALNWTLAKANWSLIAGASYTHITASDNEVVPSVNATKDLRQENGRQRLEGAFVEGTISPTANLSFTGTLRKDHWSNYDAFNNAPAFGNKVTPYPNRSESAWSPSVGVIWTPLQRLSLHMSGYESFRAPTLNELYRPYRVGAITTNANPDLTAERYRGAQIGATYTTSQNTRVSLTYFDGYASNVVTNVTCSTATTCPGIAPSPDTQQRQNVGRIRARGLTISDEWSALPGLTFWTSYTHVNSRVISADQPGLVGLQVAHVPANNFSATMLTSLRGWSVSTVERFGGANWDDDLNTRLLPSFWTTDLSVSRSFGRFAPYVAAENLFDRRFAVQLTPSAVLNSPRAVTAGVRIELGNEQ